MANWKFDKDGNITDGLGNLVKFSELVKFDAVSNTVKKISGESVPISVTDADAVGGIPAADLAKKALVPISTAAANVCVSSDIQINQLDFEDVNFKAMFEITGQGDTAGLATIGDELLPNTTFDTTDQVAIINDANLSVANNALRVNAEVTDYPAGEMTMTLTEGKFYTVVCSLSGTTPAVSITDPNGVEVLPKYTTVGNMIKSIRATVTGDYKFTMHMNSTADDDTAIFSTPSVKEINLADLKVGDYFTYTDIDGTVSTHIETGMKSSDINYNPLRAYSNEPGNNIAFLYDDFNMLEYINATPGLSGYVKESLLNSNGDYVGDLDVPGDLDSYNIVGNTSKAITDGMLDITRSADGGDLEVYINVDTIVGKEYLFSFDVKKVTDAWWGYIGTKEINIENLGNDVHTYSVTRRVTYEATENVTRIKFVCKNNATTDQLQVDNISLQELDDTVWVNVTPTDDDSVSKVYSWDNINITCTDLANPVGSNVLRTREFSTIYGVGGLLTYIAEPATSNHLFKRGNSAKEFNNSYVKMGDYIGGCNGLGVNTRYTVEYYDKVTLYRDPYGKLQLCAYSDYTQSGMTMLQGAGIDQQKVYKGYENDTMVAMVKSINYSSGNYFYWNQYEEHKNDYYVRTGISSDTTSTGAVKGMDGEASLSIIKDSMLILTPFNSLHRVTMVKHQGKSPFFKTVAYTGGISLANEVIDKSEHMLMEFTAIPHDSFADGRYVSISRVDEFNTYKYVDNTTPKVSSPGVITVSDNDNGSTLYITDSVTTTSPVNRVNEPYYVHLYYGNNKDTNGITLRVPKRDARLYSVNGGKVMIEDIVDDRGIVNTIETVDAAVIQNITKDSLK